MRSKTVVSLAVGGLALLVAGLLCGLIPFSIQVPEYGVKSSEPYVSGKSPQFYSAAHDKYCGSAWYSKVAPTLTLALSLSCPSCSWPLELWDLGPR